MYRLNPRPQAVYEVAIAADLQAGKITSLHLELPEALNQLETTQVTATLRDEDEPHAAIIGAVRGSAGGVTLRLFADEDVALVPTVAVITLW